MKETSKCDKIMTNRRRLYCPVCGKGTVLFFRVDTLVKNLPVKCKLCGRESIVNIPPAPEPRA